MFNDRQLLALPFFKSSHHKLTLLSQRVKTAFKLDFCKLMLFTLYVGIFDSALLNKYIRSCWRNCFVKQEYNRLLLIILGSCVILNKCGGISLIFFI